MKDFMGRKGKEKSQRINRMIYILTEAGREKGMGHYTRMTAVCDGLIAEGFFAEMWLSADQYVVSMTQQEYVRHVNWIGDMSIIQSITANDIVIVDSYHVDLNDLEKINSRCRALVVIDDNIRLEYRNTIIINPNYFSEFISYPDGRGNEYHKGSECTLLRSEFNNIAKRGIRRNVNDVLITMGGTDIKSVTEEVVKYLKAIRPQATLHVVVTDSYENVDEIKGSFSDSDKLYRNADANTMSLLMKYVDFAVASAGGTTNELIRMLCPSVLIGVADNQLMNLKYLTENGIIKMFTLDNKNTINEMFDYKQRLEIYCNMKKIHSPKTGVDTITEIVRGKLHG